jgi:hypothetical protein
MGRIFNSYSMADGMGCGRWVLGNSYDLQPTTHYPLAK